MRSKPRLLLSALILLAAAAPATPALAGTYTVRQCDYAAGIGVHDFRWQASGAPSVVANPGSGCGEFGLAARNGSVGSEQTYPSGGYGGWFAYAPNGTAITRFSGTFGTLVGCCVNGMATYAEASAPGASAYLLQGALGNHSWYPPSGLQGPVGRGWAGGFAATRVGFYLRCAPGPCFQRKTGDLRLRGRSFDFTLSDEAVPAVTAVGGAMTGGNWVRGVRGLTFAARDVGGGIAGVRATFDDGTALSSPSACATAGGRFIRLQPCPLAREGSWSVDTAGLPDGVRTFGVHATDVGGTTSTRTRTVRVDNTPPATPLDPVAVEGHTWRRANGFTIRWTNPGGQHAPIAKAIFRACPSDGGPCVTGGRTTAPIGSAGPILLPRAGDWSVRVWLVDAAGNGDATTATRPLSWRFDPDPPVLRFRAPDRDAPALAAVDVGDVSGIATGTVELRRRGTSQWESLQTARRGEALVAEIDDASRRGPYELRARATDLAGNHAVTAGPTRLLPVRAGTRLSAAIVGRRGRSDGITARHRSAVAIRGRLTTSRGRPLAGRPVAVALASRDRVRRRPSLRTDAAGRFSLVARADRSAVVTLRFGGDRRSRPSARRLAIRVPAPVTMRTDRRMAVDAQRVVFTGRVRGGALPRAGKLVEVQAHFRSRWRTIATVRAGRSGRWAFGYSFRSSGMPATYHLRARVPTESGYPFATGTSRSVRVTVLGW